MTKVICKNCGGENLLHGSEPYFCEYCGSEIIKPVDKRSGRQGKKQEPPHICMLSESYDSPSKLLVILRQLLKKKGISMSIIDATSIVDVEYLYVPLRGYSGYAYVDWEGVQVHDPSKGLFEERKYLPKQYVQRTGRTREWFSVAIPCGTTTKLADDCRVYIPLLSSGEISIFEGAELFQYGKGLVPNCAHLDDFYASAVPSVLETTLSEMANKVLAPLRTGSVLGDSYYDDIHYSASFEPNITEGTLYYVPLVRVLFAANGSEYEWTFLHSPDFKTFLDLPQDKIDVSASDVSIPELKKRVAELSQRKKKKRFPFWLQLLIAAIIGCGGYFYGEQEKETKHIRLEQEQLQKTLARSQRKADKFIQEHIGKTYEDVSYSDYDGLRFKLINDSIIEYQEGYCTTGQYGMKEVAWHKPKRVPYRIDIDYDDGYLVWGDYRSDEISDFSSALWKITNTKTGRKYEARQKY